MFHLICFDLKASTNNELSSVCIPYGHSLKWTQQGIEYTVRGSELKSDHSYAKCYESVLGTINAKFNAPFKSELSKKKIYAFSYFYDRLNSSRLFQCNYNLLIVKSSKLGLNSCLFLNVGPDGGSIKLQTLLDKTMEGMNKSTQCSDEHSASRIIYE
jgi:hypothetical protein